MDKKKPTQIEHHPENAESVENEKEAKDAEEFDKWLCASVFNKVDDIGLPSYLAEPALFDLGAFMFMSNIETQDELNEMMPHLLGNIMSVLHMHAQEKGLSIIPKCEICEKEEIDPKTLMN